jgi:ABC-type nitrate/sulfonate/bicarbonate transport system substrate-binding protein
MNKVLLAWFTALALLTTVHAADRIRIGAPPAGGLITMPLAQKKGFLKEEGIDAEIITIAGGIATAALANDEINYFTGLTFPIRAAIQGLPVKIVACYLPASPFVLITRPEFKTVQELKGKTLGIAEIGRSPDVAGRMILKHFGLDSDKDVQFVRVGATDGRIAAMRQGLVAATAIPVPWDVHAKKMGFNVLAKAYELFSYPESGLVVTAKRIKERPDELKRVIKAGIKANRYIRSNRDATIQFQMEWLRIDRELATASYDSLVKVFSEDGNVPENGLMLAIEEAKKLAKVDRQVALGEIMDLSFLRAAQKELGILPK